MTAELVIRDATTERKGGMTSVVFAGSIGTIIEWYEDRKSTRLNSSH